MYAQDPAFNALDVEFLSGRGSTILKAPQSERYMSSTTFLFLPYGIIDVIARTVQKALPPLLFCNDLADIYSIYRRSPGLRQAFAPLMYQWPRRAFPPSKLAPWLDDHVIYIKPDSST